MTPCPARSCIRRPHGVRPTFQILFALAALTTFGRAQTCALQWLPGQPVRGTDALVDDMTMWDPDGAGPMTPVAAIGGDFQFAGFTPAARVASYDPGSGGFSSFGPGLPGESVTATAVLANGDLVVGAGLNVKRWDGSTWVQLGNSNGFVQALAVLQNGDLIAGGTFSAINAVAASGIARWDGSTWTPLAAGIAGQVHALLVRANGDLIAGGGFTGAGATSAQGVARWDGSTWNGMGFPTSAFSQNVYALAAAANGDVVAGGDFSSGGLATIGTWNGTTWSALGTGTNGVVYALETASNGDLMVGGSFTSAGGISGTNCIARWNGTAWAAVGTGLAGLGRVRAIVELPNGDYLAGGGTGAAGTVDNYLQRWNGTAWQQLGTGFNHHVRALSVLPGGDLLAGGSFTAAIGVAANRVARWNGLSWSAMGNGVSSAVNAIARTNTGDPVVGGENNLIRRWTGTTWSTLGTGVNGNVLALATLANGDLIAGGQFTTAGGVSTPGIARWNGAAWSVVGTAFTFGQVRLLTTMANGDLIAAGDFHIPGGIEDLARWNGTTWSAVGPAPVFGDGISAMTGLPNGDLLADGIRGGLSGMLRWNGLAWSTMNQGLDLASGVAVWSFLVLSNSDLFACGGMFLMGSPTMHTMVRWNGSTWSSVAAANDTMFAMARLPDGDVAVGGRFKTVQGSVSAYYATVTTTCPATVNSYGTPCTGSAGPLTLTANNLPWAGSTFATTGSNFAPSALGISLLGFLPQATPLVAFHPAGLPGCDALVDPITVGLHVPVAGNVGLSLGIPTDPSWMGAVLRSQVVQLELDPFGAPTSIGGSNALAFTLGAF